MAAGAPPKYKDPNEFAKKVDEYFEFGRETRQVIIGGRDEKTLMDLPVYTITGLALYLGFESRQSLYDYAKKDKFSYIVKRAQLRIENMYEGQLQTEKPTGAIFALKNMGWIDSKSLDHTTAGERISPPIQWVDEDTE